MVAVESKGTRAGLNQVGAGGHHEAQEQDQPNGEYHNLEAE